VAANQKKLTMQVIQNQIHQQQQTLHQDNQQQQSVQIQQQLWQHKQNLINPHNNSNTIS
jgi:hypothetical protein